MSTHEVSSLDSGRLIQCLGLLAIIFAGTTSFDAHYWVSCTLPMGLAGIILLLLPYMSGFTSIMQGLESRSKKPQPNGPNRKERKAEQKAERVKEKQAAAASGRRSQRGQPSDAQIEAIKKEVERRQQASRLRSRSSVGRRELPS